MRNVRLLVEYDGTGFVGWQIQREGRSVQGEIARVLGQVLQEEVNLLGAGRTDAGVHASGQVANFRTQSGIECSRLHRALNGLLPEDIRIHRVDDVPETFHARFDARERRYRYAIATAPVALGRQYCWQIGYALDRSVLPRLAALLPGDRDFGAFCKSAVEVDHTRCTVTEAIWEPATDRLTFRIAANRFLHGMVRALVGTMVDVARGYTAEGEFEAIMASGDRRRAGMAAPACGLMLERVLYADDTNEHEEIT
jgi:tRNA pseudouridine38-40 synthase